jgi:hypothetical protein
VTREEMLGLGKGKSLFDETRDIFWEEVRNDPAARRVFEDAGFEFGNQPAPKLQVRTPAGGAPIPPEEVRVSIDHIAEKAIGENWRIAIDADNLRFEFQNPNAFREIVQMRHPELRSP